MPGDQCETYSRTLPGSLFCCASAERNAAQSLLLAYKRVDTTNHAWHESTRECLFKSDLRKEFYVKETTLEAMHHGFHAEREKRVAREKYHSVWFSLWIHLCSPSSTMSSQYQLWTNVLHVLYRLSNPWHTVFLGKVKSCSMASLFSGGMCFRNPHWSRCPLYICSTSEYQQRNLPIPNFLFRFILHSGSQSKLRGS